MRFVVLLLTALAATTSASAGSAPSYTLTFTGSGVEHHLDQQQNIQDSGLCDSAEHVDVTASLLWTASWNGLKATGRGGAPAERALVVDDKPSAGRSPAAQAARERGAPAGSRGRGERPFGLDLAPGAHAERLPAPVPPRDTACR